MRWASFDARGLGERFVVAAGRGQRDFFRRHDGQDGQRGLGADAGDAGQHLKAVALLLGSKAVERDVVLGDVHNRINGPLLPGGGQGLAGGGGDLDKIADPAAADDDGIQRFLDDFSGKAVDHGVSFFCMVESLPPWGRCPRADEGQLVGYRTQMGDCGNLIPHPALRGHLPPLGGRQGIISPVSPSTGCGCNGSGQSPCRGRRRYRRAWGRTRGAALCGSSPESASSRPCRSR